MRKRIFPLVFIFRGSFRKPASPTLNAIFSGKIGSQTEAIVCWRPAATPFEKDRYDCFHGRPSAASYLCERGQQRTAQARRGTTAALSLIASAALLSGCASSPGHEPASDQSCLTGTVVYEHYDAESGSTPSLPAPSATWTLSAVDGGGAAVSATGSTALDGSFEACVDGGPIYNATVTVSAENEGVWRVVDTYDESTVFAFSSEPVAEVSGVIDLETLAAPDDVAGAFKAADSVSRLYAARGMDTPCWTPNLATLAECRPVVVSWNSEVPENEGGWWDPEGDKIVLAGADPSSQHLVLHEMGHWWSGELYGGWFPEVTGCEQHFVDHPSTPSCAWTEGFADAVAAWVLGDRAYVLADGTVTPFEAGEGLPWEGGDITQGNVAAAPLDLWAFDGPDGTWGANISLMLEHPSSDFREYFLEDRPAAGLSATGEAADLLLPYGIDYRG